MSHYPGTIARNPNVLFSQTPSLLDFSGIGDGVLFDSISVSGTLLIDISDTPVHFTSADVGKVVVIASAGPSGQPFFASIMALVVGHTDRVTLSASATVAVSGAYFAAYGTDNALAFQNAASSSGYFLLPRGRYLKTGSTLVNPGFWMDTQGQASVPQEAGCTIIQADLNAGFSYRTPNYSKRNQGQFTDGFYFGPCFMVCWKGIDIGNPYEQDNSQCFGTMDLTFNSFDFTLLSHTNPFPVPANGVSFNSAFSYAMDQGSPVTIVSATQTSPIIITTATPHGVDPSAQASPYNGPRKFIRITGALGMLALNGNMTLREGFTGAWIVTYKSPTELILSISGSHEQSVPDGPYTANSASMVIVDYGTQFLSSINPATNTGVVVLGNGVASAVDHGHQYSGNHYFDFGTPVSRMNIGDLGHVISHMSFQGYYDLACDPLWHDGSGTDADNGVLGTGLISVATDGTVSGVDLMSLDSRFDQWQIDIPSAYFTGVVYDAATNKMKFRPGAAITAQPWRYPMFDPATTDYLVSVGGFAIRISNTMKSKIYSQTISGFGCALINDGSMCMLADLGLVIFCGRLYYEFAHEDCVLPTGGEENKIEVKTFTLSQRYAFWRNSGSVGGITRIVHNINESGPYCNIKLTNGGGLSIESYSWGGTTNGNSIELQPSNGSAITFGGPGGGNAGVKFKLDTSFWGIQTLFEFTGPTYLSIFGSGVSCPTPGEDDPCWQVGEPNQNLISPWDYPVSGMGGSNGGLCKTVFLSPYGQNFPLMKVDGQWVLGDASQTVYGGLNSSYPGGTGVPFAFSFPIRSGQRHRLIKVVLKKTSGAHSTSTITSISTSSTSIVISTPSRDPVVGEYVFLSGGNRQYAPVVSWTASTNTLEIGYLPIIAFTTAEFGVAPIFDNIGIIEPDGTSYTIGEPQVITYNNPFTDASSEFETRYCYVNLEKDYTGAVMPLSGNTSMIVVFWAATALWRSIEIMDDPYLGLFQVGAAADGTGPSLNVTGAVVDSTTTDFYSRLRGYNGVKLGSYELNQDGLIVANQPTLTGSSTISIDTSGNISFTPPAATGFSANGSTITVGTATFTFDYNSGNPKVDVPPTTAIVNQPYTSQAAPQVYTSGLLLADTLVANRAVIIQNLELALLGGTGAVGEVLTRQADTSFKPQVPIGGVTSFDSRTGVVTLNSADVTTALGYTPLNSSGFSTGAPVAGTSSEKFEIGNTQLYEDVSQFYGVMAGYNGIKFFDRLNFLMLQLFGSWAAHGVSGAHGLAVFGTYGSAPVDVQVTGNLTVNGTAPFDNAGSASSALSAAQASSLQKASNLFDLANTGTARSNLGAVSRTSITNPLSTASTTYNATQVQQMITLLGQILTALQT